MKLRLKKQFEDDKLLKKVGKKLIELNIGKAEDFINLNMKECLRMYTISFKIAK